MTYQKQTNYSIIKIPLQNKDSATDETRTRKSVRMLTLKVSAYTSFATVAHSLFRKFFRFLKDLLR